MSRPCDVVIVGGGAIGCAVAYFAAQRGLQVTLIDQPRRGRATSAAAGGLWPVAESLGLSCGRTLPGSLAAFAQQSSALFPDLAGALRDSTGLDVELQESSLLFLMFDQADEEFARQAREGNPGARALLEWLTPAEIAREEPAVSPRVIGAVRVRGDDQVNPHKLADALRAGARGYGATILTHSSVIGIDVAAGQVRAVRTQDAVIPCATVVNAAGSWAPEIGRMVGVELPVRPVRGQIVCTETLPPTIAAVLSAGDCYLAQKQHGEILIGSTSEDAGFDTGVTPAAIRRLCAGALRAVPALESVSVRRVWSGFRPGTPDDLPILGPVEGLDGYLNATGHFRSGILNAPLTGLVLAELAAGESASFAIEPFLLARLYGVAT